MKGLLKYLLCFVLLISAVLGGPSSSNASVFDPNQEGAIVLSHSSTDSLLPVRPKHDTALVAAPDGTIYLVEVGSGETLWSFTSGTSIYSSYQALQVDQPNASELSDKFLIDCDGELYKLGSGFTKKLPLCAEKFIRSTPYVSADGGVMLGSKKTSVFLVDAKSGGVVRTFKSDEFPSVGDHSIDEKSILAMDNIEEWTEPSAFNLDAVDEPLYIRRTDYALKYSSLKTGKVIWYLMFADIEASPQCHLIEDSFGEISSKGDEFGPKYRVVKQLPLDCQTTPVVYRIPDYHSLDNLFVSGRLPSAYPGGTIPPLPASDLSPILGPVDKLLGAHRSDEGETLLALPPSKTKDSGILGLPSGDSGKMNMSSYPETMSRSPRWILLVVLLLSVLGCICSFIYLAVKKWVKLDNHAEDFKVQVVTSKKKKSRKSGNNKSNTTIEKMQKNVSHGMPLTFSDSVDSLVDGRKIGKLFVSNKEIAKGSNGTIVLEGFYDGRPVAVKRLVQTHHDVALKEIQNLIASDQHPNIVRWYGVEYDQDFVYLSLERCTSSLHDLIDYYSRSYQIQKISKDLDLNSLNDCAGQSKSITINNKDFELWKPDGYPSPQLLKLMRDIVSGLAHLHELGIIHRDLKPQNVLVIKERFICAKLSDMGISKRLAEDMSSLTKHATGFGSSGWQAPEQLLHERQTRAVDLFSLGCLLFFCITGGKHPFGGSLERDVNIVKNHKDLFLIENNPEAMDLISRLLDPKPDLRPKAEEVLPHPFFWNSEMRLSFLRDASDRVEVEDRENDSEILQALESIGTTALGGKWNEKMDIAFINDIGRYRRYKFDSVRDFLRVIRNKLNHYRELPREIQGILGQVPEGFESYFSSRFPKLLIEVYKVFHQYCAEEESLRKYFRSN
ncbi:unnamed protein product [Ilex paraguariensis]|uniref:non-specific serine/threonine protein kinase n=1 Tax=Ilex paraguariensis TaxID=185542 RepID=A0ABC8U958_9AQUA